MTTKENIVLENEMVAIILITDCFNCSSFPLGLIPGFNDIHEADFVSIILFQNN